jgi:hypothetical protein
MAHYIAAVSIRRRLAGFCRPVVTPWDRPFFGGRLREQITPTHALGLSKIFFAKFTPVGGYDARKPAFDRVRSVSGRFFVLCFQRRQGDSPPAKPLQEVDNMQEVSEGMNAVELQEFKASLLKAERLEILEILREAENLDAAIEAIRQRKNG